MVKQHPHTSKFSIGNIVRILITLAALIWIFNFVSFEKILLTLRNTQLEFFLLAVILFQLSVFIRTFRWKLLLHSSIPSASYKTLLMLNYSGSFFDVFLPTGFGGDIIRTIELKGTDENTTIIDQASIVLLDRFSGFIALFTICIAALPFAMSFIPGQLALWIAIIAVGGLLSAVMLISNFGVKHLVNLFQKFSFTRSLGNYLQKIGSITHTSLSGAWLVSLFFYLFIIGFQYSLSLALHSTFPITIFFVFTPIVSLTLLLPSIQGLGIRENTYEYLLTQAGAPEAMGVSLGLLIFAVKVITGLIGGVVYLYYTISKKKSATPQAQQSQIPPAG